MSLWSEIKHLFEVDEGMLPDIYVENLSDEEIVTAYEWVMGQCIIARAPTLWSKEQEREILIKSIRQPAKEFVAGKVESFRHCLEGLKIDGVVLPELSVCVENGGLSFDYRPGAAWNEEAVLALFSFLRSLKTKVPGARIFQADEGCYSSPSPEFGAVFSSFLATPSHNSLQARRP